MILVKPGYEHLPSYVAALERQWWFESARPADAQRALSMIENAPDEFLKTYDDPHARSGPVPMPDGSLMPRLPGLGRWMWDGEFCGSIGLRWQNGTADLPPWCLGHIGYSVVPWKQRRGYATAALAGILPEARALGLPYVELTTNADNLASQKVILANGGFRVEEFEKLPMHGGGPALRFRIDL
ncbi:MAG TPA: GNAT family N-acetyltransferase [Candidatus Baltobacteraceae bacterium]|nr:GNAT family N-acetyltransferase [Candidatus Baltobacteraceae bacterium]